MRMQEEVVANCTAKGGRGLTSASNGAAGGNIISSASGAFGGPMMLGRYAAAEYGDKHQYHEYGCKKKWWRTVLLKMGAA